MEYGKKTEIKDIGHDTVEISETTFVEYRTNQPSVKYEQRIAVEDFQDELAEYVKFRQQTAKYKKTEFRYEENPVSGKKYIIKVWQDNR